MFGSSMFAYGSMSDSSYEFDRRRLVQRPRHLGAGQRRVRADVHGLVGVVVAQTESHAHQQRPEVVRRVELVPAVRVDLVEARGLRFSPSASTSTLCTVRVVTGAAGEKLEPWFVRCIQPFCTATFAYR